MMRQANIQDLHFILTLILNEAKNGHFSSELLSPKANIGFEIELRSILTSGYRPNGLRAYGLILEEDKQAIGFVIMSAGPEKKGNELWMSAVNSKFRGQGYGKKMIIEVLNNFKNKNLILMARCSKESEAMYHILTTNGFKYFSTGENNTRALIYDC